MRPFPSSPQLTPHTTVTGEVIPGTFRFSYCFSDGFQPRDQTLGSSTRELSDLSTPHEARGS
jgi:hypothetical protein